jgi:NAD(P)-dependent dehydrogenase (short-subunit alcohol dehydrogenase family)
MPASSIRRGHQHRAAGAHLSDQSVRHVPRHPGGARLSAARRGGINTTSITAYRGSPHLIDYAATKGAIVAFTRSLAAHLQKRRIRINAVAPGPVWTPLIPASFPAERVERFGEDTFLGRPAEPDEIAPSYIFLASDDAVCMTGQVLHPNGGEIVGG